MKRSLFLSMFVLFVACGPEEVKEQQPVVDAGIELEPTPASECSGVWVEQWVSDGQGARLVFYCEESA